MESYNNFIEYMKSDSVDIKVFMGIMARYTNSTLVGIYKLNEWILSDDKLTFPDTIDPHINKIQIIDDKVIVIPCNGYTLCLMGRELGYKDDIVVELRPFLRVIDGLLKDELDTSTMFLVNMSHEIRTPLNGVIGYAQLLEQTELKSCQKANVRSLTDCSVQLMQIINNILDISRLTAGKIKTHMECFSMTEIEDYINNILVTKITQKKQQLKFRSLSTVPSYIIADKQKIIQILINLVSNAHKYSNISSHINVTFSVDETDNNLVIKVIDEGVGIPRSKIDNLFEPFSRLHPEDIQSGSGLGLVISKKLAILMGGDIAVESVEGRGSEFTVTVKYRKYKEVEEEVDREIGNMDGMYVLVVDDTVDNRILLSEQLHSWNMNPIVVASAKEALNILRSKRHDIIVGLIDICMPEIDGIQLAKTIKEENPLLPLIALSSLDSFVPSCDFETKLDKPVNKIQLYEKMKNIITKFNPKLIKTNSPTHLTNRDCRILVAEDNMYNSDMLIKMLNNIGYENIDVAVNGIDAVDKLKIANSTKLPYKVLLLDLSMPQMDGYEVIQHIKNEGWDQPHIIVVTASVITGEADKCMAMGVEHFVSKPIDYNSLKRVIIQLLSK
jgi:CheY-like chemotaxis protein